MPITRKTISVTWLQENNACNLDVCRRYFADLIGPDFTDQTEINLTPEGIMRASQARVLSTNWLARRILDGAELKEYEKTMHEAMDVFERTVAPVLAGIIARSSRPLE